MASFSGKFRASFEVGHPAARVAAHFADRRVIAAHFAPLKRWELVGEDALHFVLAPQHYGVTTFHGDYTCRYSTSPGELRWVTVDAGSNVQSSGVARFLDNGRGGCTLDYSESIQIEVDVPRLLAKALGPVVEHFVAAEAKAYVERMIKAMG